MKVDVYFDIVCPWCYIGERRFLRALAESGATDVELEFRPFQLDPGAPAETRPLGEYLTRRFGAMAESMQRRVSEQAAGEGIAIDWDRALIANTARAHRLVRLATLEYGAGEHCDPPGVAQEAAPLIHDAAPFGRGRLHTGPEKWQRR